MTSRMRSVTLLLFLVCASTPAAAQIAPEWLDVVRNLRHPDADTRLSAVNRLADASYTAAAAPVAALITDPDDRVQAAAIDAQIRFFQSDRPGGGIRVLGIGGSSLTRAQEAFEAGPLLRAGMPAPPVVLEQLLVAVRDANEAVRFDAIHAFGFIAEAPIDSALAARLAAELDHYDPIIRAATARVVGRLQAPGASDALAIALLDSSPIVRRYAIEAVGLTRDASSAATVREQVYRVRGDQLEVALLALARLGQRDDLDLFRQRAADRNPAIRRAAIEGMGRAGDRDSLAQIESVLQADRAPEVRLAAAFALQLLGQQQAHVIAPMLALREVNAQARDYLIEIGAPALPGIIATLNVTTDERPRADLVQLIGRLGTPDYVQTIEPLAADRSERVRRAVAHATLRLKR